MYSFLPLAVMNPTRSEHYDLLHRVEKSTGRGALPNTSFNLHGYPIVPGPKEAM
jgi:carbamoyltransferase